MTESTESTRTSVKTLLSNMQACLYMMAFASVVISMSSATDFTGFDVVKSIAVHPTPEEEQTTPKSDEGLRRKRWISSTDSTKIIDKINSLRASVGASNMNYLTYSTPFESDVSNWTSYCNYDADFYTRTAQYAFIFTFVREDLPDHISELEDIFTDPKFYNSSRSVYLRLVGAGQTTCNRLLNKGKNYTGPLYLTGYAFSHTSAFNASLQQYTLGEPCTTCRSGRYWCYQGNLCSDDCSASDSNCYCNAYCLNCANTNSTTCMCQCLDGWTGLRCDTASDGGSVITPSCTTTPRVPITWTTTTVAPKITTIPTTVVLKTTLKNVAPIGKPTIQLSLYAALVLFPRLFIN